MLDAWTTLPTPTNLESPLGGVRDALTLAIPYWSPLDASLLREDATALPYEK